MGQDTSQPAYIPKVVTISIIVKKTTCADALQPSVKRATSGRSSYRTSGRFLELPTVAFALPSHSSRTTEYPGGFSRAPTSEFGHLRGIHNLTGHPEGSSEHADIWVWSIIWNRKTYRTSGRFIASANIAVWASFWNW